MRTWSILFLLFLVLIVGPRLVSFTVDILWFRDVGYASVFWTMVASKVLVGLLAFVVAYGILALNLHLARIRSVGWGYDPFAGSDVRLADVREAARRWGWIVPLGVALLFALGTVSYWLPFQAWRHQVPTGVEDPVFGRDVSFYLFSLPLAQRLRSWLQTLLFVSLAGVLGVYFVTGGLIVGRRLARSARAHIGVLLLGLLLVYAWGYWLARFDLLYSRRGVSFGASYTDLHAQLPAYTVLLLLAVAAGIFVLVGALRQRGRFLLLGLGTFLAAAFLGTVVVPSLVQKLVVEPNELEKEAPYIARTIRFTRLAYDLEEVQDIPFEVEEFPNPEDLQANRLTLENVRLWDWRPLRATYRQLQEIRPYYSFYDVDVDRYRFADSYRQVMLSARELDVDQLPPTAQTWVNLHLKYTHGYGLCMSPVNQITPEGMPYFYIRDIPPVSTVDLPVTRPAIYFGELTRNYVLVRTSTQEFDYPLGQSNQFTTYQGDSGIPLGSFLTRMLFSLHLRSSKILLTRYLTAESRILLYRTLRERIRKIAPFLLYDSDPYLVVSEGRLFWIQDAYTFSDAYPYSQPYRRGLNYLRNSVKIVVDAYTGQCDFYIFDEDDPIIRTYEKIFPKLFKPASEMPEGLFEHIRYPEDLFYVQARMYATYHMTDPQVFYNREDLWEIPRETQAGNEVPVNPYYIIMKLPGAQEEEMVLMLPFSPAGKDNMIAWMAARCDRENYGERMVFLFPKKKLIFGPRQVEARIDQDPAISQLLTLWSQRGSQVLRGNLLVIPIARSLIYVEPLYIQAEKGKLPELKRVIVAASNRISIGTTLEEALEGIFGRAPEEAPLPGELLPSTAPPAMGPREAWEAYQAGREALRRGDWAAYGQAQRRLEEILRRWLESSGTRGGASGD
jgi:hypothetical protein